VKLVVRSIVTIIVLDMVIVSKINVFVTKNGLELPVKRLPVLMIVATMEFV
jgi:hypothetical protein